MDIERLVAVLDLAGVPKSVYGIGRNVNETYCVIAETDGWHVFYSERGNRNLEKVFEFESEACEELIARVLRDGAVHRGDEGNRLARSCDKPVDKHS